MNIANYNNCSPSALFRSASFGLQKVFILSPFLLLICLCKLILLHQHKTILCKKLKRALKQTKCLFCKKNNLFLFVKNKKHK